MTVDKGVVEFTQPDVKQYFLLNKLNLKFSLTGRSRQLANVERLYLKIGSIILLKRQANQELLTGTADKQWVKDIPTLIKYLNQHKKTPLNLEKKIPEQMNM